MRDAGLPDKNVGTAGKGNRDAKGPPHKPGESPSRLRASRRYKSKGARFRKGPLQEREADPSTTLGMTQQERSR